MKDDIQIDHHTGDEIDLREIFQAVWVDKILIIAITALFAVASVSYALYVTNEYKAEVLLVPAQGTNQLSGALGQLGGLASLAGVNIQSGESSEVEIATHIANSWGFISKFVSNNGISVELAAVNGWDKDTNQLKYNEDIYDFEGQNWMLEGGPPSDFQLFKFFEGKKDIVEDKMTGLVTISVNSFSPHLAKKWLDLYVAEINKHMQDREIAKVSRNIDYLEMQLKKTESKEMQKVLYQLIGEQIKNKMVTEASPDYIFVPAGPSMLPQQKFRPKRAMISIWGTTIGGILSLLFVLIRHFVRKSYKG